MTARTTRRLGGIAAVAMLAALLPFVLGSAGATEPVPVPAGTTLERSVTIELPTVAPAEVVLLVDATGSEFQSLGPALDRIVAAADQAGAPLRIAVARVGDYPVRPFGVPGDAPYELLQPLTQDPAAWQGVLDSLTAQRRGGDPAEGQIGALAQAIQDSTIGFTADATKVAIVVSDAPAHDGGDIGCDDNGTCVPHPGPASTDVADLAAAAGVTLASIGTDHGDALRTIAPAIGPAGADDPLVALFVPQQLTITPAVACEDDVSVAFAPASVSGLPGSMVTVQQTITSGADTTGLVTCTGSPLASLDLVVDTTVPTEPEAAPEVAEDEPPAETATEPAPEDESADDGSEGDDTTEPAAEPTEPLVATLTIEIDQSPYLLDIGLSPDTQEALDDAGVVIEEESGEIPFHGFTADLVAELTEEPLGGLVIPDPEEPRAWEFTPVAPGTDSFVFTFTDPDGSVVATITVVFEIAEAAPDEEGDDSSADDEATTDDADDAGDAEEEAPADDPVDDAEATDGEDTDDSDAADEAPADDGATADEPAGDGETPVEETEPADEGTTEEPADAPADEETPAEPPADEPAGTDDADDGTVVTGGADADVDASS